KKSHALRRRRLVSFVDALVSQVYLPSVPKSGDDFGHALYSRRVAANSPIPMIASETRLFWMRIWVGCRDHFPAERLRPLHGVSINSRQFIFGLVVERS